MPRHRKSNVFASPLYFARQTTAPSGPHASKNAKSMRYNSDRRCSPKTGTRSTWDDANGQRGRPSRVKLKRILLGFFEWECIQRRPAIALAIRGGSDASRAPQGLTPPAAAAHTSAAAKRADHPLSRGGGLPAHTNAPGSRSDFRPGHKTRRARRGHLVPTRPFTLAPGLGYEAGAEPWGEVPY